MAMTPTMIITLIMTLVFFALMIFIGIRSKSHAKDVTGFVLGSRNVGPWLSAFAYGTSYFPPLFLSVMPDSLAGTSVLPLLGSVSAMRSSVPCLHG